jgi:acyl-CoA thioesterase-2
MTLPPLNSVQPDLGGSPGWDKPRLNDLLTLTPGDGGVLRSSHAEVNANGTIYGGQLIGQAIAAAAHDIAPGMNAHSLQLNFLAPGKTTEDLQFEVRRLLHGRSFIVQHVLCLQSGRPVFSAHVSFHCGEPGPDFAQPMPQGVPPPEALPTARELVLAHADEMGLSEAARQRVGNSRNLEMRPVNGRELLLERQPEGRWQYWIRASQPLPALQTVHQAALGYLTDYWLPIAAMAPHLERKINSGLYIASLNHALWFHAPLDANGWMLVDAQSQHTGNGRGLTQGHIYSRDGRALAKVLQETLFRGWAQQAPIPA